MIVIFPETYTCGMVKKKEQHRANDFKKTHDCLHY